MRAAATGATKADRSVRKVLAANVRRLREQQGWSLEVLARRLRMGVRTLTAIESGGVAGVRIGVVEAIARVFKVEVADVLIARRRTPLKRPLKKPARKSAATAGRATRRRAS